MTTTTKETIVYVACV